MKYYSLKNSTSDDIGKVYPQTDGMSDFYSYSAPDSLKNLPNLQLPDFEPNLDYFIIDDKAKLTDVISTGLIDATGLIVNDKVKDLLQTFHLMPHKFFPAKLLYKKRFYHNYYWLHLGRDYADTIDYKKSNFELKSIPPWDIPDWDYETEGLAINNRNDLIEVWKQTDGQMILPTSLHLNNQFDPTLDLVAFRELGDHVLISQNLKNVLEKEKVNGIEIKPLSYPIDSA